VTIKPNDFVHLHGHSKYSVNDGMCKVEDLVEKAKELGFDAIALTEHGKLGSTPLFSFCCEKAQIQGIIGSEMYLCKDVASKERIILPDGRTRRPRHWHLPLLCKNETGFHNLVAMQNIGYTEENFYHEPRIDFSILEKHAEGLIALSGCLGGQIPQAILDDQNDLAREIAKQYKELFGDDFYLEVQYHGIEKQVKVAKEIFDISVELNIPVVATQDYHYLHKDDSKAHDVMKALRSNDSMNTGKGYSTAEFYLKSAEQMYRIWGARPEVCRNTLLVAEKCRWSFPTKTLWQFPKFNIPENEKFNSWCKKYDHMSKEQAFLMFLCQEGLKEFGLENNQEYTRRLKKELNVIYEMATEEYFLILWDVFRFCNENDIGVGPGRGSGAGSLVLYLLKITMIDPIQHNLIFERFLNEGRSSQYDFELPYSLEQFKKDCENDLNYSAKFGIDGKTVRKYVFGKIKKENRKDLWSKIKREILPLENQKLDKYYTACFNYVQKNGKMKNIANSWIAYAMGLTDEEPTGPLKVLSMGSLPDVDSDFEPARRDEVVEYCKRVYSEDAVVNIGTYGEYKARSALQGVLKHPDFKYSPEDAIAISKTIPVSQVNPIKLVDAVRIKYVTDKFNEYNVPKKAIEYASKIEGSAFSSISEHAAGIIIAPHSLHDKLPMHFTGKKDLVTQYDMTDIELAGYVKLDFLGLNNVGKIKKCLNLIKNKYGKTINLRNIPQNDEKALRIIATCNTSTIFQLSSNNIKDAIRDIKVNTFEDIAVIAAMYRPGPMRFISRNFYKRFAEQDDPAWRPGMTYSENKQEHSLIKYPHADLEEILKSTYGIIVYQEQIMAIMRKIGGFSMAEADKVRKAIGKKNEALFLKCKSQFFAGANKKGYSQADIDTIWRLMEKFSGYAFNKAHATSYALIAYWNAYLMSRYPYEWYAASITEDYNREYRYTEYIKEAKKLGLTIIKPTVNLSGLETRVQYEGNKPVGLILPLNILKGIGKNAERIPIEQPFKDFNDFCNRILPDKRLFEVLLHHSAFNGFGTKVELLRKYDEYKFRRRENKRTEKYQLEVAPEIQDLFGNNYSISVEGKLKMNKNKG
jgi:DNA polymerase III alpha subunit